MKCWLKLKSTQYFSRFFLIPKTKPITSIYFTVWFKRDFNAWVKFLFFLFLFFCGEYLSPKTLS